MSQENMRTQRNSSVELLRVICIVEIVIHHFVAHEIVLEADFKVLESWLHLLFTWQNILSYSIGWGGIPVMKFSLLLPNTI